jgi:hypothetical protein
MTSAWFAGSGFAPRATTLCELLPPLLNRNKGMQLIDSCVSFLEVKVVTIRYARIIAHPLTDFRQALSGNCEKGAERMAHDMRRDPRKILLKFFSHELQIEIKRADEIVAVATLTALDFRCDTPRSVHPVAFQESNKNVCQRNRSRFTVLRSEGFRLLHSNGTPVDREPRRTGLHNLVPTQPCFKSSVHDKAHHPSLVFRHNFDRHLLPACQQSITKFRRAIFRFRPVIPPSHADAGRWIRGNYGPFLLEPRKKRPQAHHVALSGGFGHTATFLPIEPLQIRCLNRRDSCSRSDPAGKPLQGKPFVLGGKSTEFVPCKFESDEGFDFSLQRSANREIGTIRQFKCHAYRVAFFPSFERNRLANASAHAGKIPPAPFLIESLYSYHFFRVANRVANRQ